MKEIDSFLIRPAAPDDVSLILAFIKALAEYESLSSQVVATEALLHEWLFQKQKAEAVIGEWNGRPVGFALYFYNFSTFLGRAGIYLEDLFVLPEVRGKGFGKAFLKHLAALCRERGCGRLEWACLDWNESSIRFYLSTGAVPMDEWTVYRVTGDTLSALSERE